MRDLDLVLVPTQEMCPFLRHPARTRCCRGDRVDQDVCLAAFPGPSYHRPPTMIRIARHPGVRSHIRTEAQPLPTEGDAGLTRIPREEDLILASGGDRLDVMEYVRHALAIREKGIGDDDEGAAGAKVRRGLID